ncbi:unnamed protein product [Anisakis simplex]|uniref:C2H2-type domain-containing protein n=1 Tax=Anisakis simplex TaxID=6269 RepID=A0A158PN71_ANISI|nr:unnamed protein product [Anisakis simplex]
MRPSAQSILPPTSYQKPPNQRSRDPILTLYLGLELIFINPFIQLLLITTSWCRNKKYIERVSNGFMCTVCRKVYGRYNSVSYHVTIYHRNPPIKCDENGCCRKCPFCRHVSKSPAMLEKHIGRHIPDCSRDGALQYRCPKCATTAETQREIYEHILQHQETTLQCDQCNYRGRTPSSLDQHKLFKHSKEMFKEKLECVECNFKCVTSDGLLYHYERMHRLNTTRCSAFY